MPQAVPPARGLIGVRRRVRQAARLRHCAM